MKVSVMFQKKISGSEPYSSEGYHVALESEPPPEVSGDREKLANYVMALAAEARARVEQALADGRIERLEREPATPPALRHMASSDTTPRTPPLGRNGIPRIPTPARRDASRNGANGNAHAGNGEGASYKQLQFARSLGARLGMSAGQLSALCEENFGRTLDEISKKDASALISQLRTEAA